MQLINRTIRKLAMINSYYSCVKLMSEATSEYRSAMIVSALICTCVYSLCVVFCLKIPKHSVSSKYRMFSALFESTFLHIGHL